jgi:hypothetical protein
MISPQKISWDKYTSNTIPVDITTCLSFGGDSGDIETYLGREAVVSETYNGEIKRGNSYKWSESLSPSITIMKKDFSDFTRDENRKILAWLTGRKTAGFLDIYLDKDSNTIEYSMLGNFISVSQYKLGNSRVVGYVAQFEALMPWALSPLHILPNTFDPTNIDITKMKDVSAPASNTFTITIDTDEPQTAVYPRITIKCNGQNYVRVADTKTFTATSSDMIPGTVYYNGTTYYWRTLNATKKTGATRPNYEGWTVQQVDHAYGNSDTWETGYIYKYGTTYYWLEPAHTFYSNSTNPNLNTTSVKITNTYTIDGAPHVATCRIANNTLDETIILDAANKVISSSRTSRIFGNEFIDWEWLPLYDGMNTITVEGNCSVGLEYRTVVKCGEY